MSPYPEWSEAQGRELVEPFRRLPGGLLPALHALQNHFGHIHDGAIAVLADVLNQSRAEIHGVISFYHDFRRQPRGRHLIKVCQAEACQSMGSRALTERVKDSLGVDFHQTTEDGLFSLEPVYCLGNCACSPALMVDEQVFARVDGDGFEQILKGYRQGAADG